jgi:hypothetical protein
MEKMNVITDPRLAAEFKPEHAVKVDLDDRSFLFPAGKLLTQLVFTAKGKTVHIEAIYPFNEARTPPRIASLDFEDARELGRRLVEAVHHARTQLVVSAGTRITINVIANGYHLQIGDLNQSTDLFLGTNCIWRVCQGILRIVDYIAPVEAN